MQEKTEIKSPVKAIRAFCIKCMGDQAYLVKDCPTKICPLKPFRFGKNPFIKRDMTDEQKESAVERLLRARDRINNNKILSNFEGKDQALT